MLPDSSAALDQHTPDPEHEPIDESDTNGERVLANADNERLGGQSDASAIYHAPVANVPPVGRAGVDSAPRETKSRKASQADEVIEAQAIHAQVCLALYRWRLDLKQHGASVKIGKKFSRRQAGV